MILSPDTKKEMPHSNDFSNLLPKTLCSFFWQKKKLTRSFLNRTSPPYHLEELLSLTESLVYFSKGLPFFTLLELAEAAETSKDFNFDLFFSSLGYKNLDFKKLLPKINQLPESFFSWAKEKSLSPKDLRAFLKDYKPKEHALVFNHICQLNPTKSTGLLLLEYALDLLYSKAIQTEEIFNFKSSQNTADLLLKFLRKKRFQKTFSKDELISDKISKLQLSKNTKLHLKREGDVRNLHLEIKASSPQELLKILTSTEDKIDNIKNAWKN